jgi:hypothetical protein
MKARFVFYNVDNNRDPQQVNKELKALLNTDEQDHTKRPAVLGLCETTGLDLPDIGGYKKVRDRSTKSRANIAAYVRNDLFNGHVQWVDLTFTWPKTQGSGMHEPRSYVFFEVGQMQTLVYHAPPKNAKNSKKGQQQGIDSLTGKMNPKPDANDHQTEKGRWALGDWNRRKSERGPGPTQLGNKIDGKVYGGKIDALVKRGKGKVTNVEYVTAVDGVKLKSDHGHAYRCMVEADDKWWAKDD